MSRIENPFPVHNEPKSNGFLNGNQFFCSATEDGRLRDHAYRLLTFPVRLVDDQTMRQARDVIDEFKPTVVGRLSGQPREKYVNTLQGVTVDVRFKEDDLCIRFSSRYQGHLLHEPVEYSYHEGIVATVPSVRVYGELGVLATHGVWYTAAEALYITDRIMQLSPNQA